MTPSRQAVERSMRIYRGLLRCYPAAFRQEFGDEMSLVFRELATDAWEQRGHRGLANVWVRVLIDFARTVPYQHYLARTAEGHMTYSRPKTVALAVVSIATALTLNFVVFASLGIGIHLATLLPIHTSFRASPHMDLWFLLICPAMTGFIACRTKPFYRPFWTAPAGPMLLALVVGALDSRAPWYGVIACLGVVGAATLAGCFLSTRLQRQAPAVQAA